MAKLLIFRGEKKLDERELTEQTVRIGRAPQNDLVLEDPGKGVSRNHAEIRFESGRYTLVDLDSQNGIWVSGTRVPSILLEPGVSAALGPFRVMVEKPASADTAPMTMPPVRETTTEMTLLSERSAAPLVLDNLAPPAPKPAVPMPAPGPNSSAATSSSPPPKPAPTPKRDKTPPAPTPKPAVQRAWYADQRVQIGSIVALLLVVASAVVGYKLMHRQVPAVWHPEVAESLVESGKCQEALDTQINPALKADPANQQAIALRDRCNTPPPPPPVASTSSIPPAPTVDDRLNGAETLLAANVVSDCQTALVSINEVLAEDANNERAKTLSSRANTCISPPAPVRADKTPPVDKPAVLVAPSAGGLDILQGETDKAYKVRMGAARKKYDDAVAVLAAQRYVQAMRLLDDIVSEVPVGYLDLAQRRDEARSGIRAEGKSALESAQAAEKRNDFDTAIGEYRRAHQLDPSLQVDAAVQRVSDTKLARGVARCNQALTDAAYDGNNPTVILALQEAIRLLPPTDPCSVKARAALPNKK